MAGFFQQFLKGVGKGLLDPDGSPWLKNYQHASKTFGTDAYGNAPKFKWLFHVYFDINKTLITDNDAKVFPEDSNHGLLVKSIELPKFGMNLVELNQYNRKRYVQTKMTYDPIRVLFHDDNANTIRHLWYTYYSYYFNDPSQPNNQSRPSGTRTQPDQAATDLNRKNIYDADISKNQNWGYMGEISNTSTSTALGIAKAPFFKSISIFGFNQHNFVQYQLINPIIEAFGHDTYSYAETNSTMENSMTLRYESVKYFDGAIDGANPGAIVKRFGERGTYDRTLSPISRPGGNRTIIGQGGLLDAVDGVLNDLSNGNIIGALQTTARTARTFKTGKSLVSAAKADLVDNIRGAIVKPGSSRSQWNIPAAGASVGTGSQNVSSTNGANVYAPPISTDPNSPIPGRPRGGG
jgi:hypothetical protein